MARGEKDGPLSPRDLQKTLQQMYGRVSQASSADLHGRLTSSATTSDIAQIRGDGRTGARDATPKEIAETIHGVGDGPHMIFDREAFAASRPSLGEIEAFFIAEEEQQSIETPRDNKAS